MSPAYPVLVVSVPAFGNDVHAEIGSRTGSPVSGFLASTHSPGMRKPPLSPLRRSQPIWSALSGQADRASRP